jgi:hypothetical protein
VLRARRQVAIGGNAQANRHHAGNRAVCGGGASAQRACGDSSTIRVAEDTYVSQGNPNARQASSPSARSRRSHRSHRHPAAVGPDRVLLGVHGPAGPIDLDRGPSPGPTSPRWGPRCRPGPAWQRAVQHLRRDQRHCRQRQLRDGAHDQHDDPDQVHLQGIRRQPSPAAAGDLEHHHAAGQ